MFLRRQNRDSAGKERGDKTLPAAVADMAEDGILHFRHDGKCRYENPRARVLLEGVLHSQLKDFLAFVETEGKNVTGLNGGNMMTGAHISCLLELRDRLLRVRIVPAEKNGTAVILTDITDIRSAPDETATRMNAGLREMECALDAAAGGIAVCCRNDMRFVLHFANRPFRTLAGIESADYSRMDVFDNLREKISADSDALRHAALEGRSVTKEWRRDDENGTPRWFEITLSPLGNDGNAGGGNGEGNFSCMAVFLNDATEAQMRKAQLFQSQKLEALGQLAGGVAHDFNNLLSIVDGYTRMAIKHVEQENPAAVYLERIKQANRRGAALTKQLLTFGRHKIVSESVVDAGRLLEEQEPLFRPLLNASINLVLRSDKNVFIECGADSIAQIFMNLVINARDAMPDGGSLVVSATVLSWEDFPLNVPLDRKKDRYACLTVEDTGTGIDYETQARIFDPFFTTKEQGKGTGLGLSMVYGIVRQAGGVIDVRSAPGAGTAMNIYFPLSDKKPEVKKAVTKTGANGKEIRFDGYTALIAEDEPDLLFVVGNMLEDMGITVIKAGDGNEALLRQDDFEGEIDFLLTDVVMPDLNGIRLAEMMEELRPETKILFMSGYPANGDAAKFELPGNAWLLAKPVEFEKLASILAARLESKGKDSFEDSAQGQYRWQSTGRG